MRALIEALSAYIKYFHDGRIEIVSFDGETLMLRMAGARLTQPLAAVPLHGWVEGSVRQFFPTVKIVQVV
jgi:hypothetical protein